MRHARSAPVLVAILLISIASPIASAEVSVALSANPTAQEATTEDEAEYDIIVQNDGDEDISVSLSTQQDNDCNGFTSTLETFQVSVSEGSSETVKLTVSVNDQADGDCETTVNAQATGSGVGTPANDDVTVTTTAGDGGGLYSVSLSTDEQLKTYDGETTGSDSVTWDVDVENNGEQQANVQLEMTSDSDCESDSLDATVDPQVLQLDPEDTETVEVTVDIPDGSSTEAGEHCFILKATVTNDPNAADQAEDNLTLTLKVPERKECDPDLQFTSHNLDPGDSATNSFEVENVGNTEWTVTASAQAQNSDHDISGWVDFDSPLSKLLSEPGGSQDSHTFTFSVTPDDSVESGTQVGIKIQGRAGTTVGCEQILTVTVGQSHAASLTLSKNKLNNVEPGSSDTLSVQITNQGNGMETMSVGAEGLPPGWQVSFSQTSVTVGSANSGNNKETVTAEVFVPEDASAVEDTVITFTVGRGGGSDPYDSKDLTVSVAAKHSVTTSILSTQQTGRSDQTVQFPIDVTNSGNIQDTFKLQTCDPNDQTGCNSPMWQSSFSDSQGNTITQIVLEPGQKQTVFLDVLVEGEEDADSASVLARIAIYGTNIADEHTVTVVVSNYNYAMAISPQNPGEIPDQIQATLPPGGTMTASFWVENTGDYPGGDTAVITVSGMESSVVRSMTVEGVEIDGTFSIGNGERVLLEVHLEVSEGVANGVSGVIEVGASSQKNTAQRTTVDIVVEIRTIHDLRFTLEGEDSKSSEWPDKAYFTLFITNHGNVVEDVEVLSSESLRGWTVNVDFDEFELAPGETKEVQVSVVPPSELLEDDTYIFTVTVQPEGLPVAGEPIDLEVTSVMPSTFIGLSEEATQMLVYGSIILGSILVVVLFFRSRAENRRISEVLENQFED